MYNHVLYFIYWLINAVVLYVFGLVFSGNVVLGNWRFSPIESAIYSGFWVTFLIWTLWDYAIAKGAKFDTNEIIFGYFFLVNAFSFWLVSKFSEYAGFGITGFGWTFGIGLAAYVAQRIAWRLVVGKK